MSKKILLSILFLSFLTPIFAQEIDNKTLFDSIFIKHKCSGAVTVSYLKSNNTINYSPEKCEKQLPPGWTVDIISVIAGLEKGIIKENEIPNLLSYYRGKPLYGVTAINLNDNAIKERKKLWAEKLMNLKRRQIKKFIKKNSYGSAIVSKSDDLQNDGKLTISPNGQMEFVKKLYNGELTCGKEICSKIIGSISYVDSTGNKIFSVGEISGKTDTSFFGWHVGWVESNEDICFFAIHIDSENNNIENPLPALTNELLIGIGVLPKPTEPEVVIVEPKPTLDEMIGQMILVGVDGTSVDSTNSTIKAVKKGIVGGVIIYEKNISKENSHSNLKSLVKNLNEASKTPLFICIDQEGGKVNRLKSKYGFPATVTHQYLGNKNNDDTTFFYADTIAYTLASLGINVNFAPVVDLGVVDNFIKKYGRCFSENPGIVTRHAQTYIKAHRKNHIITTLKHFPGHGSAAGDSHLGMANVTDTWKPDELTPYKEIIKDGGCDAIMTAHIVNFELSKDSLPGTLSKKVINGILRDSLNFDGVVFSDDMQMKAISKFYGFENSVALCINAGVDVLMYSHNVKGTTDQNAQKVHNTIKKLVNDGLISPERIEQSYRRIIDLKQKFIYLTL